MSAVIPVYNRADKLQEAIRSVLAQTYESVEVVVVDDGSTEDIRGVVSGFDARVRYVRQDNKGAAAARNTGIREARGEYVALLDSDDRWVPWKTALQVDLMRRRPDLLLSWTDFAAMGPAGEITHARYLRRMYAAHDRVSVEDSLEHVGSASSFSSALPDDLAECPVVAGDLFSGMILGNLIHTSTVMVRREAALRVGGYNPELRTTGEDYDFHLRICRAGPVGFADVPTTLYQVGDGGQATAPHMMLAYALHNLETVSYWVDRDAERIELPARILRQHLSFAHLWAGSALYRAGQVRRARRLLRRALRYQPTSLPAWRAAIVATLPHRLFDWAIRLKRKVRPAPEVLVGSTAA